MLDKFSIFSKKIGQHHFLLAANTILSIFGFSFLAIFFKDNGMPPYAIILVFAVYILLAACMAPLAKKIRAKEFLAWSFVLAAILLLFLAGYGLYGIYITAAIFIILYPVRLTLCWLPLNNMFFEKSGRKMHSQHSFIFNAMPSIFSIFLLPVAALIIAQAGYPALFCLGAVFSIAIAFVIFRKVKEKAYSVNISQSWKKFKGLRTITMMEGATDQFNGIIIPVAMLFFVTGAVEFGGVLTYFAILSIIVAYFLAKHSDRHQKRLAYLLPLFIGTGLVVFALGFAGNFLAWIVLVTLYSLLYNVSYPLRLAFLMDARKKGMGMGFWSMREICLNAGRFITLTAAALLFYLQIFWAVYAMYALIFFAYPFVAKKKLKIE